MPMSAGWQTGALRLSPARLGTVAFAHAGLLALLTNAPAIPEAVVLPRPLTVSLIQPEFETPQSVPRPTPPAFAVAPRTQPVMAAQRLRPQSDPQPMAEAPQPLPAPVADVAPSPQPEPVAASPAPVTPPRPADYRDNPKPPYPSLSRRQGEEGTVRLSILVNPDGSVARLELAQSSGHPRLDRSAMETVQSSWTFEPAREGSNPVAAWVVVPIQFTLRS